MKKLIQQVFFCFAITTVVSTSTKTIMKFWNEQDAAFQLGNPEKVVLILGDTGTGKTSLALLLTNATLEATKNSAGSGLLQIRDKNDKIGTVTSISQTITPELFIDRESNISYYDCPGFQDTRSAERNITIGYLVNKLLTHAKSFKIVIVVNHSSVRRSETQSIFPNFIETFIKLFKNIDNYKDGIAMVATKVMKTVKKVNGRLQVANDTTVVLQVVNYLKELKNMTMEQMSPNMPDTERQFNEEKLKLLNVLLENNDKTENGYDRIGVFRAPSKAGLLSNDQLIQKEKQNILKIIKENIKFVGQNKNIKYGPVVSTDSQIYVNDLIERIVHTELHNDVSEIAKNSLGNNIHKHIQYLEFLLQIKDKNLSAPYTFTGQTHNATQYIKTQYDTNVEKSVRSLSQDTILPMVKAISTEIKEFYNNVEQSTTDIYLLRDELLKTYRDLTKVDITKLQSLADAVNNLNITIKAENLHKLNDLLKNMKDIPQLVEKNMNLIDPSAIEFRGALQELKKTVSWYDYMTILDKNLPAPTVQTTPSLTEVINTLINACDNAHNVDQLDFHKLSPYVPNNAKTLSSLQNMPLNSEMKKKLKTLLSLFVQTPTITCPDNDVMTVTGTVIKMSEVTSNRICFPNARSIEIFATISVIIDSSVEINGSNINMAIMSPVWTVIDSQTILLKGSDGKPKNGANDCDEDCSTPQDGEAGNPGGAGGNFLGIGGVFLNGRKLKVSSVGGNGGAGSNGGKGSNGVNGSEPSIPDTTYVEIRSCLMDFPLHQICIRNYLDNNGYAYEVGKDGFDVTFWKKGSSGSNGSRGGHGGVGGFGGKAGLIEMIELDGESHLFVDFHNGKEGSCGKGGVGGKAADVKYFVRKGLAFWTHRLFMTGMDFKTCISEEGMTDAGPRGLDCGSVRNRQYPESAYGFNHASDTIKKFKELLNQSLNGSIRESQTRAFVDETLEDDAKVQQLLSQK